MSKGEATFQQQDPSTYKGCARRRAETVVSGARGRAGGLSVRDADMERKLIRREGFAS